MALMHLYVSMGWMQKDPICSYIQLHLDSFAFTPDLYTVLMCLKLILYIWYSLMLFPKKSQLFYLPKHNMSSPTCSIIGQFSDS